jgi:hypothetical protein
MIPVLKDIDGIYKTYQDPMKKTYVDPTIAHFDKRLYRESIFPTESGVRVATKGLPINIIDRSPPPSTKVNPPVSDEEVNQKLILMGEKPLPNGALIHSKAISGVALSNYGLPTADLLQRVATKEVGNAMEYSFLSKEDPRLKLLQLASAYFKTGSKSEKAKILSYCRGFIAGRSEMDTSLEATLTKSLEEFVGGK